MIELIKNVSEIKIKKNIKNSQIILGVTVSHTVWNMQWWSSGIHKGHCDVADPRSGGQAFVVVSEAAGVHEGPAFPGGLDGAVVSEEAASTTLHP